MPTIEYQHSSMVGTFPVPCDVLDKKEGRYFISFINPLSDEKDERWVDNNELRFPSFGDLVM